MAEVTYALAMPSEEDARLVFEWRNDALTRAMSLDTRPKVWEQFLSEYRMRMFSLADLPPLFIVVDGMKMGFLFFEPCDDHPSPGVKACRIAINLRRAARGKGIGTSSITTINEWVRRQGYQSIFAEIRDENAASRKAFQSAGYKWEKSFTLNAPATGEIVDLHLYRIDLAPAPDPRVYIIAEAGSNWHVGSDDDENERQAMRLIEAARESGADAVKFQVFRAHSTYAAGSGKAEYLKGSEDIAELFRQLEMPYEMIPHLQRRAKEFGLDFMASGFSLTDFQQVARYIDRVKIASYEISHGPLIQAAAESGKPTYISTGAASFSDIGWAVELFRSFGGGDLTLMHCIAEYPATPEALRLRVLPAIAQRFMTRVGFSDHSAESSTAPVAAVALGASSIEKHITLDKGLAGPDHKFALTPDEFRQMVQAIRHVEPMLGGPSTEAHPLEVPLRDFAQRRLQAIRPIKKGELLRFGDNIDILRPGEQQSGVHPRFLVQIEGKRAERDIALGEGIQQGDWR